MMLRGNSRTTALVGGICALKEGIHMYEQVQATIVFRDGVIIEIKRMGDNSDIDEHIKGLKRKYGNLLVVRLDNDGEPCHIFPGLVDIHNHIDYNMMPIWNRPVEEPWDNRHEWRNCTEYLDEVKGLYQFIFENWKQYLVPGKKDGSYNEDPYTVIQFFAELQAIAGGTTALQESTEISYPSDNHDNFANKQKVHRKSGHILLRSTGVPTDLGLMQTQNINSVIDFFKPDVAIKSKEKKENISFYPPIDTDNWKVIEIGETGAKTTYFQEYLDLLKNKSTGQIASQTGGYMFILPRAGQVI